MKRPSSVRIWLAVAASAIAAAFFLTFRVIGQSNISNAMVSHTQQTLSVLVAVEAAIGDVIFASGDEQIRQTAIAAYQRLDDLAALTFDNPRQQLHLKSLRSEISALARTRRTNGAGTAAGSQALVPQSLAQTMREVRLEELQLLTTRMESSDLASRRLGNMLIIVALGSGGLLLWVFGLVVRDDRKRQHLERVLRRANDDLDQRVSERTAELNDALGREHALRNEAEASNRLKDEFLMTVSHELRTPLNALLGWADMLRLGILSDVRRKRAIEAIYENARLQRQLIADLLDTSRILTGKLRVEPKVVDLGTIVRDAANVFAPAAEAKGIDLRVVIDWHEQFIGDPSRLQQIVWNLVSNAVKFTKRGTVTVRLCRGEADNHVQIRVSDTGMGISPDFLPYVFERFRQEKTGTTRPHSGLGLGLTIVRQLVELHGGSVRAESGGEEQGARFTVRLPLVPTRKDVDDVDLGFASPLTAADAEMPLLGGVRVLVVDDDPGAREMVSVALEHCGAHVTAAGSADEARSALDRNSCDVLVVDIAMPGEDGYSLIRDLRAHGLRQPVAALTAHAHDADRARALESGFDLHIAKPIEPRALAQAIRSLLGSAPATTQ